MPIGNFSFSSLMEVQTDTQWTRFIWTIHNFSRLNSTDHYSDVFLVGNYKWRIMILLKNKNNKLSICLEAMDLPQDSSVYTEFVFSVINLACNQYSLRKEANHTFSTQESKWNDTKFMSLSDLYDPTGGFLVNDTLIVEAVVSVHKDEKMETGYVGLVNYGQTSYMNSLLQTLYHIPYFRKAVYKIPIKKSDTQSRCLPLALQRIFYELQHNRNSVSTEVLTTSFQFNTQDVQELNRVICEKLEDAMRGSVSEGTIGELFEGHHMNFIECTNVDFKSKRKESFYDLQLDVQGCPNVYASFDKFVSIERLEAGNKYRTEKHGLQDAKKGVLFLNFPPVLQLQLKRFTYDIKRNTMIKINDQYEFPLELDLDIDNRKYLSPDADGSVRNLYTLHSGGEQGGRYHAFIRPNLSEKWLKFDDERVTKEDQSKALDEQFGGEEEINPEVHDAPFKFTRDSNAYMLVYIRKSDVGKVICDVDDQDISKHLMVTSKKEQEKLEVKKKISRPYTIIKVARKEDLVDHIGRFIYLGLMDYDKVRSFRMQKGDSFDKFKEEVAKEFSIPVHLQQFWLWENRQNHTYRPHRRLTPEEETQSVGRLGEVSESGCKDKLNLFLDVSEEDMLSIQPRQMVDDGLMIFLKLYDPLKEHLSFIGRIFVKASCHPSTILTNLNAMAGFSSTQDLELYVEMKLKATVVCEPVNINQTFKANLLRDGDIICFQKSARVESGQKYRHPNVSSFLEHVIDRQVTLKRKREEMEQKKTDARLYTYIKVARDVDLFNQIGKDIYFDLVDHDKVHCFRIEKSKPFHYFKDEVAREFHIPTQFQRFWLWGKRENDTHRLKRPLTSKEETESGGHWGEVLKNVQDPGVIKLFLEVELGQDLLPVPLPKKTKNDILLFVKLYDPVKEQLRYVGRFYVKASSNPLKFLEKLNNLAGFSSTQQINLFEEIESKPVVMCKAVDLKQTFRASSLRDGGIICFQKSVRVDSGEYRFPDVPSFLEYMHNRQVVRFRSLEEPRNNSFCLELSKVLSYDEVVKRVACQLNVDSPLKIRFTRHNCYSQKPEPTPIKYKSVDRLSEMLVYCNHVSNILYYEVLNISEAGHENKAPLCKLCWDSPMEGACMPCAHLCSCLGCLNEMQKKKMGCPVCREPIKQIVRIYVA